MTIKRDRPAKDSSHQLEDHPFRGACVSAQMTGERVLASPSMVSAGVSAILRMDQANDPLDEIVREVYEAMETVRLRSL